MSNTRFCFVVTEATRPGDSSGGWFSNQKENGTYTLCKFLPVGTSLEKAVSEGFCVQGDSGFPVQLRDCHGSVMEFRGCPYSFTTGI